jgi:hypothetical protein
MGDRLRGLAVKTVSLFIIRILLLSLVLLLTTLTCGISSIPSLILGLFSFVVGLSVGLKGAFLLGVAAVVSPAIRAFDLILAAFLLGHAIGEIFNEERRKEEENFAKELLILFFISLSVIYLGASIAALRGESFLSITMLTLKYGGVLYLFKNFSGILPEVASALGELCGFLLLGFLGLAFIAERDISSAVQRFFRGTAFGLILSLLFLASQKVGGPAVGNYDQLQQLSGRYPAASSSPQALGVVVVMLSPVVLLSGRVTTMLPVVVGGLILGWFASPGVLLFGLFLIGAASLYHLVARLGRTELTLAYCVGVGGVLCSLILLGQPTLNETLSNSTGGASFLRTLNWNEKESIFYLGAITRGFRAWQESPVIGLGLGGLKAAESLALQSAGIDPSQTLTGGKSYYLQLLAESGLFGVSIFLLALTLLFTIILNPHLEDECESPDDRAQSYPSIKYQTAARIALFALAVLLFSGNHLTWPEVRGVAAVLIVTACIRPILIRRIVLAQFRVGTFSALFLFCFGFFILLGVSGERMRSSGFYPPDDRLNPEQRLSTDSGRIVVCDNVRDTMEFRMRALRPRLDRHPVSVTIHEGKLDQGDTTQRFELTNSEWVRVIVPLRPDADGRFSRAVVSFSVTPLFSPKYHLVGEDPRFGGVLVELPPGAC